jgi:hypothetical protein
MVEVLFGAIGVTAATTAILFLFFKDKVLWWEIALLLAVSLITGASFKWIATSNLTKDYEYWGTRFERVEYYEEWDEWIEETCSEECCCDAEGNGCSTTYYDCSYRDYHSEYYLKVDHLGNKYNITKEEYLRLKAKMGNSTFKDMNRDYYRIDGNMYFTTWNRKMEDYECISTIHEYENKTQAVKNVFNFPDVDSTDIETYGLFEYPKATGKSRFYQRNILGFNDPSAEHKLQIVNGELGCQKQVRVYVLVYKNKPSIQTSHLQQAYWKGGNKNEVVITVNIDDNHKPTWANVFSWSEREDFKVHIRDFILSQEKLNLDEIVDHSHKELKQNFVRKNFSEFDYLEVKLKPNQLMWSVVVSIIINFIVSIFIVLNEARDDWNSYRNNYNYSNSNLSRFRRTYKSEYRW